MKKLKLSFLVILIASVLLVYGCQTPPQQNNGYEEAYKQAVALGYTGELDDFIAVLRGDRGESAYDIAVRNGFQGSETQWLESLKGKSAYQTAVEKGYTGTEEQWLATLVGEQGERGEKGETGEKGDIGLSAYEIAKVAGFKGSQAEWLLSLNGEKGENGLSAYEIAVQNGYVGTEGQWLISLIGERGADGKSAYDVAVLGGFEGTESQWLVSLIGASGQDSQSEISAIIAQHRLIESVIEIKATSENLQATSSGIIISSDGYILTNAHCVTYETNDENPQTTLFDTVIGKFRGDYQDYSLEVVHYNIAKDLAILRFVSTPENLVPVTIGDSDALAIGDTTIVIGNAIGLGITASSGIVADTAQGYNVDYMGGVVEAIRTDSPINPGNSGGGLFNAQGQLIGVATFKIAPSSLYEGLGFGLSANMVKEYIDEAAAGQEIAIEYLE
jgi:S1-C subfamily serine protease